MSYHAGCDISQLALPIEGIALIIAVAGLLDMMRAAVNLTGDTATAVVVAKSEGKLDLKIYKDKNTGQLSADEFFTKNTVQ